MDEQLAERVKNWLTWDKNEETRGEIQMLKEAMNFAELKKRMEGELSFGTAGVRTRMEAGFNRLNELTILQLSNGMAKHLLDEFHKNGGQRQIVVGYDGRHNSIRFAQLAANVFIRNGIQVHLFSDYVPTPVVSFAVVALGCDAGLMITASHNPKEDNGYKTYWSNGAQILAPHDKEIIRYLREEPEPAADYWDVTALNENQLLSSADPVLEQYYANESAICCYYKNLNTNSKLKVTYSAFHGVGSKFARRFFSEFGFPTENISFVKEQDEPNPDFPTVPFPNPEEGHRVLGLCFKTADENGSDLILANDPDADRLQLAEKQTNGQWHVFTGNEMGSLLTWWIWTQWRQRNLNADATKVYVLNSAVSSQIVATMAQHEGFRNETSLTGFKWIGNLAHKLRSEGKTVILAWEESIGFTTGSTLDKDGVSAAAVFAELANWLQCQEPVKTLQQQLLEIYRKYGFHLCRNSYLVVTQPESIKRLFTDLRAQQYPKHLGKAGIKFVRDLGTGFDNSQPDNRAVLPLSTSSDMVTFTLETGSIVTLRASGTEPKIKYYIELRTEPGKTEADLSEVRKALDQLEQNVVTELMKPTEYGLKCRDK